MLLQTIFPSLARSLLVICAFTPTYVLSLPAALKAADSTSVPSAALQAPQRGPALHPARAVPIHGDGKKPVAVDGRKVIKSYEDIGPNGRCETPIRKGMGVITPAPAKVDWKTCSSQGGIGWLYGKHCYGMGGVANLADVTPTGLCYFPSRSVTRDTYHRDVRPSLPRNGRKRLHQRAQGPSSTSGHKSSDTAPGVNRPAQTDHADNKKSSTSLHHRGSNEARRPIRPLPKPPIRPLPKPPIRPLPKPPITVPSSSPPSSLVPITVHAPVIHRPIPLRATEHGPPAHDWNQYKSPQAPPPSPPQPSQPSQPRSYSHNHERSIETPASSSPSRPSSPLPPPPPAPGPEQTAFPSLSRARSKSRSRSKSPARPLSPPPPAPRPDQTEFPGVHKP
ncbi:hypothetical protein LshimejAT787_0802320 [Lyophyllum shimeji]|uniref:Uncharacterized protein n=1 Tax=Lyophyllum shimeji TaxID=47721 RepID=A0A9P3URM7_LYOSH|nr:hypothetical protein LshimejAT787_0802320 [Lyophyllum shimeji]